MNQQMLDIFIKGYKVNRTKLKQTYPNNAEFMSAWKQSPIRYKYLELGKESNGDISLIMVFEDAYDRESLEKTDIPPLGPEMAGIFPLGIWVCH